MVWHDCSADLLFGQALLQAVQHTNPTACFRATLKPKEHNQQKNLATAAMLLHPRLSAQDLLLHMSLKCPWNPHCPALRRFWGTEAQMQSFTLT